MSRANLQPSLEVAMGAAPIMEHRIPVEAEVLTGLLKLARRYLPWNEAADMVQDHLVRELAEAKSVGRPNMLRKRHLTSAYIKLECRKWRTRQEAARLAELTADQESGDQPDLEDEDFSERAADEPTADTAPVGAWEAYGLALDLAKRLGLASSPGVAEALTWAFTDMDGKTLAKRLGMAPGTWRNRVSVGAQALRDRYPTPDHLAHRILPADMSLVVRSAIDPERSIGCKDRDGQPALTLIARDQRRGHKPTAAAASSDTSRTGNTPDRAILSLPVNASQSDVILPLRAMRQWFRHLETIGAPVRGPRAHRMAVVPGAGYAPTPDLRPDPARPGTLAFCERDRIARRDAKREHSPDWADWTNYRPDSASRIARQRERLARAAERASR